MSTTPSTTQPPNLFDLEGHDTKIKYATTSITGAPLFNYEHKDQSREFLGDAIRVLPTPIGSLVTVTLEIVPDLHTVTLTLLLPAVNLVDGHDAEVRTEAILTTARTSIAGAGLVKGQVQTYDTVKLEGTAQIVLS